MVEISYQQSTQEQYKSYDMELDYRMEKGFGQKDKDDVNDVWSTNHLKADVDRIYLKRAEGGRGLIGVEDCVRIEPNSLEKYLQNSTEELLAAVNRNDAVGANRCEKAKMKYKRKAKLYTKGRHYMGSLEKGPII